MSNGSTTWNYTYDANGMRTSRSNGTKTYNYVYNGSQLTQMTVGNDTLYFTYGALGPATVTWNGTTYYYALNGQGDVVGIYNDSEDCVVFYNWDNAWGYNPAPEGSLASTLGTLNPLRYRGYVYDAETGYYYLQSRYYDPEIGRFINSDAFVATGQGLLGNNMFVYCLNNPVVLSDSNGFRAVARHVDVSGNNPKNDINVFVSKCITTMLSTLYEYVTNDDDQKVLEAEGLAFYKGVPVIKTPLDASFSFGIIGLSQHQLTSDTLKHEYGHTVQMGNMGMGSYINNVVVPSVTINILDRQGKLPYNYFSYPWEAEANKIGGSILSQSWKPSLPSGGYTSYRDLIWMFFE